MSPAFADVEVGDRIETASRTVTEADVANFAGVSGDFNGLHFDAELMGSSTFGERIAHGALVFSMMTGLLWQARDAESSVVAFYGVDDLRFIKPVFAGDTIHVEREITELEPYDHPVANGRARYETTVVNQDGEAVLACDVLSLLR